MKSNNRPNQYSFYDIAKCYSIEIIVANMCNIVRVDNTAANCDAHTNAQPSPKLASTKSQVSIEKFQGIVAMKTQSLAPYIIVINKSKCANWFTDSLCDYPLLVVGSLILYNQSMKSNLKLVIRIQTIGL